MQMIIIRCPYPKQTKFYFKCHGSMQSDYHTGILTYAYILPIHSSHDINTKQKENKTFAMVIQKIIEINIIKFETEVNGSIFYDF